MKDKSKSHQLDSLIELRDIVRGALAGLTRVEVERANEILKGLIEPLVDPNDPYPPHSCPPEEMINGGCSVCGNKP